jgi:hypothetical protein
MKRMTRYERWQFIASMVYFVLFMGAFASRFVSNSFSSWYSIVLLIAVTPQLLFHLAVWRNWRGIVGEQIVREQDQAMAAERSYPPSTAQRRRGRLQRTSRWVSIGMSLVIVFMVVVLVLELGGWLT